MSVELTLSRKLLAPFMNGDGANENALMQCNFRKTRPRFPKTFHSKKGRHGNNA